ncbi:MarR family winged helix-turn-helix transcriptional regulator [Gracilibacillus sp. S3-1-1]|uniref:MarR family winged helix-turn-helix transcriptional regulator n=1 Tax=Gracilibacillus pellucidus TaxID=3095368 RepID=A0ACC6M3S8_9BACI|nr:MarR family winged helix-turn-helix transcriptional regulator [Gracilibacillus sp. S3-1-1]MDX8045592.1 MarR family winged helix-turn-helix transcriptional regulator [Gracilibacillus sp. S3-1-1]
MKSNVSLFNQYWTDIYFHLHYSHQEKISHQAIRILQLIDKKQEINVNNIASHLDISHNTASEHIKRMINKKYILKQRNPLDERKVILNLTDYGKEVLHRNTSLDELKLKKLLEQLDENEKRTIESALKLLSERAKECM